MSAMPWVLNESGVWTRAWAQKPGVIVASVTKEPPHAGMTPWRWRVWSQAKAAHPLNPALPPSATDHGVVFSEDEARKVADIQLDGLGWHLGCSHQWRANGYATVRCASCDSIAPQPGFGCRRCKGLVESPEPCHTGCCLQCRRELGLPLTGEVDAEAYYRLLRRFDDAEREAKNNVRPDVEAWRARFRRPGI